MRPAKPKAHRKIKHSAEQLAGLDNLLLNYGRGYALVLLPFEGTQGVFTACARDQRDATAMFRCMRQQMEGLA